MRRRQGLTLIEVLIALAILGIGFAALAATQVSALRINARSRAVTEAKAEANMVLERLTGEVLVVLPGQSGVFDDDGQGNRYRFIDYYWACPQIQNPKNVRNDSSANLATVVCSDDDVVSASGDVTTAYAIRGEEGVLGEGVLTIAVTSEHVSGAAVTVGTSITCFEVYPSPTSEAPTPCPVPDTNGGGRRAN